MNKINKYSTTNETVIEKIIDNDYLNYNHMIFNKDEGLPIHKANSNVYMNVIRGRLSIILDDKEVEVYEKGTLLEIAYETLMDIKNRHDEVLELIVIKAPAPKMAHLLKKG